MERVGASARHLLQLIDELLTFTRVQAGREVIDRVRVEMDPLLEEIRATAEPLADAKSLRFEVDAQRAPSALITDARKVRQILVNLVGNAIKFTREGRVVLRVSAGHGQVAFRVRDTGPGISEENLERIFEPFWQVESSRSRSAGGTGLGLAISQHLAGILGGELVVKSRLREGSTFELRLPLESRGGEA